MLIWQVDTQPSTLRLLALRYYKTIKNSSNLMAVKSMQKRKVCKERSIEPHWCFRQLQRLGTDKWRIFAVSFQRRQYWDSAHGLEICSYFELKFLPCSYLWCIFLPFLRRYDHPLVVHCCRLGSRRTHITRVRGCEVAPSSSTFWYDKIPIFNAFFGTGAS